MPTCTAKQSCWLYCTNLPIACHTGLRSQVARRTALFRNNSNFHSVLHFQSSSQLYSMSLTCSAMLYYFCNWSVILFCNCSRLVTLCGVVLPYCAANSGGEGSSRPPTAPPSVLQRRRQQEQPVPEAAAQLAQHFVTGTSYILCMLI